MAGPWEKYQSAQTAEPQASNDGPWSKFAPKKEAPSVVESAVRGAAQGASFGFADEATGGVQAFADDIKRGMSAEAPVAKYDNFGRITNIDEINRGGTYEKRRDESRAAYKEAQKANPLAYGAGEIAGGVASGIAIPGGSANTLKSAMKTGAAFGAAQGAGSSEADSLGGVALDSATGALVGAGGGAAGYGAIKAGGAAIDKGKKVIRKAGEKLKDFAEKTAVNSTGATGKQASTFSDDAGRELLDQKIVRFGDSQEKIAARASEAVDKANEQISSSLAKLESNGVKVDANDVYGSIKTKITEMKSDPSKADVVRLLEQELDNLIGATDAKGTPLFGVLEAEGVKRGYNKKAGNWADPEKGQAGKELYQAFRRAVEDAAQKADPETAAMFEQGKKAYGLMAPIKEAAERRAATTAQSPAGGFLDVTTGVAGAASGGVGGAILAPIARRVVSPRLSSSVAVTADAISKKLLSTPNGAKLAQTNPRAFQAAVINFARKAMEKTENLQNVADSKKGTDPSEEKRAPSNFEAPKRGREKWANDGFDNISKHSPDLGVDRDTIMQDPKAKEMLVVASDLKPGSKAMNQLVAKLSNRLSKGRD